MMKHHKKKGKKDNQEKFKYMRYLYRSTFPAQNFVKNQHFNFKLKLQSVKKRKKEREKLWWNQKVKYRKKNVKVV